MRNSECGMRNRSGMSRDTIPTLTFRIPHSAFRILVLLAACTPITTRPDFRPDPRALTVVLDARPERVTTVLDSLVAAESLEVARANVRDGYVETAWYDTQAHRTRHHEREITHPAPQPLTHASMMSRSSIASRHGPFGRRMVSPSTGNRPATSRSPVIMSRSHATATTARGRRSRITRRASCPRVATNTGTS